MGMMQSRVSHEQFVEDIAAVTKNYPPPGAYENTHLPNGDTVAQCWGSDTVFGKGEKTSFLNDEIKKVSHNPGPETYECRTQLSHIGVKVGTDYVNDKGDHENSPQRWPLWARPSADSPGPMAYTIDAYMRQENLRRMSRSMPSLTKAMMMGP